MKNRKLMVAGVFLSDVADALEECGIPLTEQNIKRAALHVENVASAYAKATLQDTTKEDWLDWIEPFPVKE